MKYKSANEAFAYLRTSSATNVGDDRDPEKRQRAEIEEFAKRAGYTIVDNYFDSDARGSDPMDVRSSFAAMLDSIANNGLRTIIMEWASRFSRDLIVQEMGHRFLRGECVTLIASDSPETFVEDTPTSVLIHQILGAVSQFEKSASVAKLRGARERKMKAQAAAGEKVKYEGRRSYAEINPDVVARAKRLRRYPLNGRRRNRFDAEILIPARTASTICAETPLAPVNVDVRYPRSIPIEFAA